MKQSRSLRRRLFAFIITIYVLTGTFAGGALYVGTERAIRPLAQAQASQRAELETSHIAALLDREVALATKLASDPTIVRWAEHGQPGADRDAAFEQLESYRQSFRDKTCFVALRTDLSYHIHDRRRGKYQHDDLNPTEPRDRWFFHTLDTVDVVELNVDHNTTLGTTKVWINAIIKNGKGVKLGLTGTGIDISDFLEQITRSDPSGIQSILIDRKGAITAHGNPSYVRHNANVKDDAEKMTVYSLLDDPTQALRLEGIVEQLERGGNPTATLELRVEGKAYLAAVRRLEGVGWYDIVLFDASKLVSSQDFLAPLLVFVASLIALLLIMRVLLDRMVLGPLTGLTEASVAFASGDQRAPLIVSRRDEIGVLTEAFNEMTSAIADHTDNLERKVEQRTTELERANAELERSRGQILESIEVARMIQASLLPTDTELGGFLAQFFVLNRPRELVGGDFYWFRRLGPDVAAIALVDCVGHGVPGAFMTVMVKAVLDQAVAEDEARDPAIILAEVNHRLRTALRQDDEASSGIDSGAEMGLCICDRASNRVRFAGAGLSLIVVRDSKIERLAGDRQPVGYRRRRADRKYHGHTVDVSAGERLYMTTDGALDLPGGDSGFGLGRQRFHDIVLSLQSIPLADQGEKLWERLNDHRGDRAQVDDVAVLGYALTSAGERR